MLIDNFPGLNLVDNSYEVGFTGLVVAENVDITRQGKIKRRPGRSRVYNGVIKAAWGDGTDFLFLEGTDLKSLKPDYSAGVLASGLLAANELFVCRDPLSRLFWSTGLENGVIEFGVNRAWGIPVPHNPAITPLVTGELPSGRYLVAAAFVRDGIEGPLSEAALFDGENGISVAVSAPEGVTGVNLYLTTTNGEIPYFALTAIPGEALVYSGNCNDLALPAENQYLANAPVGTQIIHFAGRLFIVLSDFVIYTEPYSEFVDIRRNFFGFGVRVQAIGAVSDGLFVATEKETYFLAGTDPLDMVPDVKLPYGAFPGTMIQIDGRLVGQGQETLALLWAAPRGFCVGLPGGTVLNLTERQVNELTGTRGAAIFRQQNGQNHFITVLQD